MLTKAKMAVVAAVFVAGSVSTAMADEAFDVDLYRANPNALTATQTFRSSNAAALSSYAQAYPQRRLHVRQNPNAGHVNPYAVYANGKYIGQDPDANVRLQLRRDFDFE